MATTPRKLTREERIAAIIAWRIAGLRTMQLRAVVQKQFGVKKTQASVLMKEADEEIKQRTKDTFDVEIGLAVERYTEIFKQAFAEKNWPIALEAQRCLDRIFGFNAPVQIRGVDVSAKTAIEGVWERVRAAREAKTIDGRVVDAQGVEEEPS